MELRDRIRGRIQETISCAEGSQENSDLDYSLKEEVLNNLMKLGNQGRRAPVTDVTRNPMVALPEL